MKTKRGLLSLAKAFPEIAEDWDYSTNKGTPEDVSFGCRQRVNWVCHRCGYKWRTTVNSRTSNHNATGCKICSQRQRIEKFRATMQKKALEPKTFNCELTRFVSRIPTESLRCSRCKNIWVVKPSNILPFTEIKCPFCNKNKS